MSTAQSAPTATAGPANSVATGAASGAVAGVVGGLVFGASMAVFGMLPTVASIVHTSSARVGFVVHMAFAVIIGAGFGVFVVRQRVRARETVFWGLIYGTFWWFLGPQTLLPLLRGRPVAWNLASAQALLPSLIGHLSYGLTVAAVFVLLRREPGVARYTPGPGPLLRGVTAGVVVAVVVHLVAGGMVGAFGEWLLIGLLAGAGYPLLFFTVQRENAGPALARGTVYGFLLWVVIGLTVQPLRRTGQLGWAHGTAAALVEQLPGYLLLGAGVALVFTWLGALARGLFADDIRMFHTEPPGTRGLRATGYGALAGLVGGVVFTLVMVAVGALPTVARMVGSQTPAVGLVLHLIIAQVIGVSYAVLFRRCSFDTLSGIGWGVSYGFFWWVLGDLTLLPALSGSTIRWDAATIAAGFPSLVGHLGYGAALGAVYYRLEARTNPWWMTRSEVEADRAAMRRDQALSAAPAVWVLIVVIALTVPVLTSPPP
jgi:uncharacterized membrane protein YagU involved in acid resistance